MCEKVILKNPRRLQFNPNCYKFHKICYKIVDNYPHVLEY